MSAADFARWDAACSASARQEPEYQRETAERLHLPFPVLGDADLALAPPQPPATRGVAGLTTLVLACGRRDG
jgi:peroxiredoxin